MVKGTPIKSSHKNLKAGNQQIPIVLVQETTNISMNIQTCSEEGTIFIFKNMDY